MNMNRLNQTESAVQQTLDVVFSQDLFSDYLEITTAVVMPCGGPKKTYRTSILCGYVYIFWSLRIVGFKFYLGTALRSTQG